MRPKTTLPALLFAALSYPIFYLACLVAGFGVTTIIGQRFHPLFFATYCQGNQAFDDAEFSATGMLMALPLWLLPLLIFAFWPKTWRTKAVGKWFYWALPAYLIHFLFAAIVFQFSPPLPADAPALYFALMECFRSSAAIFGLAYLIPLFCGLVTLFLLVRRHRKLGWFFLAGAAVSWLYATLIVLWLFARHEQVSRLMM